MSHAPTTPTPAPAPKETPPTREEQIKRLAKELKAPTPEAQIKALKRLEAYGPEANVVGEALIEAMSDAHPAVRDAASDVLEKVDPIIHPHVFTVLRGMNKWGAISALAEMRAEAAIAVPLILSCREAQGSDFVFTAVAKIAPKDKRFAAAVLAVVSDPQPEGRARVPAFIHARRDELEAGLKHLDVIDATTAEKVESLVKSLQRAVDRLDSDDYAEAEVHPLIAQLQKYRADSKPALPLLKKLKLSSRDSLRAMATKAIRDIE